MKNGIHWCIIFAFSILVIKPQLLQAQKSVYALYVPGIDFEGNCIVKVNSNKYIIGGAYGNETFLLAVDTNGTILWDLKFNAGTGLESVSDLKLTSDNYVIGCGWYTPNDRAAVIFKLDHNLGQLIWSRVSPNQSMFYDIHELPSNGNYLITGSRSGVPLKALIMEFDKTTGNLLWQKLYEAAGVGTESFISSIIHNGVLYTTGRYEIGGGGTSAYRATIGKFDFTGTELWSKYYLVPVSNPARLYGQNITSHGGGLIVSVNGNFTGGSNASQNALIKTDNNGNILWAKRQSHVGYPDLQLRDVEAYNGRIYSTGWAINATNDFLITEVNANGDLIKTVALQGFSSDRSWRNSMAFDGANVFSVFHSSNLSPTSDVEVILVNFNLDLDLDTICNSLFTSLVDVNVAMPSPFEINTSLTLIPSSISLPAVTITTSNPQIQVRHINEIPEIDLGNDTVLCANSLLLNPVTKGADTYLWNNGSSDSTLLALNSGIYWCTVTHTNGCTAMDSIIVNIASIATITVDTSICAGGSYFAGGAWQTSAGTYIDTITVTGACDTIKRTNLSLTIATTVVIDTTICDGQAYFTGTTWLTQTGTYYDTLITVLMCDSIVRTNLTVAPPNYTMVDTSICDGESYFAGGQLQTTGGTFLDSLIDSYGCDSIVTTKLSIDLKPMINIGPDTSLCAGQTITLQVSDPFATTFLWQNGSTNSSIQTFSSGIYWVIASTAAGCIDSDSLLLLLFPKDQTIIDSTVCVGDSIFFNGEFISDPGSYHDTLMNFIGCDSILTINLQTEDSLEFDLGPDQSICTGELITLAGPHGSQLYIWSDGSSGNSISLSAAGVYWLKAYGICNSFTDSIVIETDDSDFYIWIPNCFTPNNDGFNETYRTPGFNIDKFQIQIYNRWGQLMFESNRIDHVWDGTYKGGDCPDGTYVYLITYSGYRCGDYLTEDKSGWITIMR